MKRSVLPCGALACLSAFAQVEPPASVARRVAGRFLEENPTFYQASNQTTGAAFSYGGSNYIHYATCSLWVNALECARLMGDDGLEKRLVDAMKPLADSPSTNLWHGIKHVDFEITGAVPLAIANLTGDVKMGRRGLWYADRQWEMPCATDNTRYADIPLETRMDWWKRGYSSETRLWIDDMYMISALQLEAFRYTGDSRYLDRAAREMSLYLDRLPRRGGLFFHAPFAPFAWARGNGWMAAAMPMILGELPPRHPEYAKIRAHYGEMMAALLKWQRPGGLWGQLVDDPESWDETSGSAMFAFAFSEGVRLGLLGPEYAVARDRAYAALVGKLDERANLLDVCIGTGARNDREWYLRRGRMCGDPHGQAPMLWLCRSMLDKSSSAAFSLDPADWKDVSGVKCERSGGRLVLAAERGGREVAAATELDVPAGWQGERVDLRIRLKGLAPVAFGNKNMLEQYDAGGRRLSPHVVDSRWISHVRPSGREAELETSGRIHPKAAKLRLVVQLNNTAPSYDESGHPVADGDISTPRLELAEASVSIAAPERPLDPRLFADGASGRPGDRSFVLTREQSVAYHSRSWASWAQGEQVRELEETFFPVAEGTVEAWFRPAWNGDEKTPMPLVSGCSYMTHSSMGAAWRFGDRRGLGFLLAYTPNTGLFKVRLTDAANVVFEGESTQPVEFNAGAWKHVALTWVPDGDARVWVGGRCVFAMPLKGYRAIDLANDDCPNDVTSAEIGIGATHAATRGASRSEWERQSVPMFTGAVDDFRASSCVRYTGDFTPSTSYVVDADTRALFTFDGTVDGVSGGGLRHVEATVLAPFPIHPPACAALDDRADPRLVLDTCNYPVLPTAEDFDSAYADKSVSWTLSAGERRAYTAGETAVPDFVEILNAGDAPLVMPVLLGKDEADPRSYADFRRTYVRDGDDRDNAKRIFQYLIRASDYFMGHQIGYGPDSDAWHTVQYDALVMLNAYCGFECGPLNNLCKNLFVFSAGCPSSMTSGYGHLFEQVFYDGKNHCFDLSAMSFFPAPDNVSEASLEEMEREPGCLRRVGQRYDHYVRLGTRGCEIDSVSLLRKVGVTLGPGESFRSYAVNDGQCNNLVGGRHSLWGKADVIGAAQRYFPLYGNAFIAYRGVPSEGHPSLGRTGEGSFGWHVSSVYPIVSGRYSARLKDGRAVGISISTDGQKTWRRLDPSNVGDVVKARSAYWLRVDSPLESIAELDFSTEVMTNVRIFPGFTKAGGNEVSFVAESGGPAQVTVGWREKAKSIRVVGAAKSGVIVGREKRVVALDPSVGLSLSVEGAGKGLSVAATRNVRASLERGRLKLSTDDKTPRVASVMLDDGGASLELTVVVAPGVRLVPVGATLAKAGDRAVVPIDGIAAGRHAVLNLWRTPSVPKGWTNAPLELRHGDMKPIRTGHANNTACDFYKAVLGRDGGRGAWKWGFPIDPKTRYCYERMAIIDLNPANSLVWTLKCDEPEGGIEFSHVLIVPEPDFAFEGELLKFLCGYNSVPHGLKPRGDGGVPAKATAQASPEAGAGMPEQLFPPDRFAKSPEQRLALIEPARDGELRLRPTFSSVSVCLGAKKPLGEVRLEYRKVGGAWRIAPEPPYFEETRDYRGSIMHLEEDTAYEVRIGGRTGGFRTWKSDVPVAKEMVLDPHTRKFPVVIDAKGTEKGWVRYSLPKGTKLVNPTKDAMFLVKDAAYVLLDGMTLEGGPACNVINVVSSSYVRVVNCDISKWGRVGRRNFENRGRLCEVGPDGAFGPVVNYDAAIAIREGTVGAVVERCYVHDPNGTSVSWYYCHPAGPEAVMMYCPDHSTVLRWNDFVGSDVHRWNDAVEGHGNFQENGGFNRDADVYGNYMAFANDDCIELDGGQQNVRSFHNRYEGAFCGVSIQGCMASPVYLDGDVFVDIVDENDRCGQTIKTSGFDLYRSGPWAFLSGLAGYGRTPPPWIGGKVLTRRERFRQSNCEYGMKLPDHAGFEAPARPLPFSLDVGRFGGIRVADGKVAPATLKFKAVHDGAGPDVPFEVKVNEATDWLSVSPASGVIPKGGQVEFTLTLDAGKMTGRRHFKAAFLVRTPTGLSRVCSVIAESDWVDPVRPAVADGRTVVYADAFSPASGVPTVVDDSRFAGGRAVKLGDNVLEYEFEVPKKGRYHFALHGAADAFRGVNPVVTVVAAAVDGVALENYDAYTFMRPTWSLVAPGKGQGGRIRAYDLDAGRHTLRLRMSKSTCSFDSLALTDDPIAFEPR